MKNLDVDTLIKVLKLLDCGQEGEVKLPYGVHEEMFFTKRQPVTVWVSAEDEDYSVCQADLSMFTTRIVPDGFVLYADVKSENVRVKWYVEFEDEQ